MSDKANRKTGTEDGFGGKPFKTTYLYATPDTTRGGNQVGPPGGVREQPQPYRADWNTKDFWARDRLEKYRSAVTDAMQQPVVSVRATADRAASLMRLSGEDAETATELIRQRLAEAYPGGFMSPADFLRESNVQAFALRVDSLRAAGREFPEEIAAKMLAGIEQSAARQAQAVVDRISHRDFSPESEAVTQLVRQVVQEHSPKGAYAPYGQRTASENAAAATDPAAMRRGGHQYTLTPEGAQNHRALRVAELFSASDENYPPASGISQASRFVAGTVGLPVNYWRGLVKSPEQYEAQQRPLDEMGDFLVEAGKFGYATNLYNSTANDGPQEQQYLYRPDHTPKFYSYDPTNIYGIGQAMHSTSFPMAKMYNETAPVREVALHGGELLADRDPASTAANIRRLRREYRAITPVVPDGFDPAQHRALGEKLDNADGRMEGMLSATWGPKFADAGNLVLPGAFRRTYMSPAMSTLLSVPGESLSDPFNLIANLTLPAAAGAFRGAAEGMASGGARKALSFAATQSARGLSRAPFRMADDVVEEGIENNALGSATVGFGGFFSPEKDNLLMRDWQVRGDDGKLRQGDPNSPGYDKEVERRHLQARSDQMGAADDYGLARWQAEREVMDSRRNRPVAGVRFGAGKAASSALAPLVDRPVAEVRW